MDWNKRMFDLGKRGIYVIIDPQQDAQEIIDKLRLVLSKNIIAVQVWDNGITNYDLLYRVISMCKQHNIPVLINNRVDLLLEMDFDGIHFDDIPSAWKTIKEVLKHKYIGITCTNDLRIVEWATAQQVDYISFCSIFESKNNSSCDLVDFKNILRAREISTIPFILAGGITLENIDALAPLDYQAVAMISGIMSAQEPQQKINTLYKKINNG